MHEPSSRTASWHEIVLTSLKSNNVGLVVYVPDRVFTPLIEALHADAFFTIFAATREEEAIGIVTGAWMGGLRGAVLMQTSGFATVPNALASLVVPCQIPVLLFVSERPPSSAARKPSLAASATIISICGRAASARRTSTCWAAWDWRSRSRSAWR